MKNLFYSLVWISLLLYVNRALAQVQSNIGFSQQVQPKRAESPDNATQTSLEERKADGITFLQNNPNATYRGLRATVSKTVVLKYGILTDGDFSQAMGKDGKKPLTGSIGFNILRLKPVSYEKVYDYSISGYKNALQSAVDTRKYEARQAQLRTDSLSQKALIAERQALAGEKAAAENSDDLSISERATRARATANELKRDFEEARVTAISARQFVTDAQKSLYDDTDTEFLITDEVLEPSLAFNAVVSFGPSQDTLRIKPNTLSPTSQPLNQNDFGQSLLLPGSAAASGWRSASLSARWFPASWWVNYPVLRKLGLGGDIGAATTYWGLDKRVCNLNIVSGSAGLYYTLANTVARDADDFALRIDIFGRYAFRQLSGDILEESDIITKALGTTDRYFFDGYELGCQTSLNSLRITVTWSQFGEHITGFSNGKFIIGIGFSTAFRFNKTEKLTGGIVHE